MRPVFGQVYTSYMFLFMCKGYLYFLNTIILLAFFVVVANVFLGLNIPFNFMVCFCHVNVFNCSAV